MASDFQVILVILSLNYELEICGRDLVAVQSSIKRWCKRGMHGKRMLTMIVVTDEFVAELGTRLHPVISRADSIETFWIFPAPNPDDICGHYGNLDPAVHWIREAWIEARERNKLQHVRKPQRRHVSFKQGGPDH